MDETQIIELIQEVKAHVEQFAKKHGDATANTDERLDKMVADVQGLVEEKQASLLAQKATQERLEAAEATIERLEKAGVPGRRAPELLRAAMNDFIRGRADSDAIKDYHATLPEEVHTAAIKELGDASLGGVLVSPDFANEIIKGVVSMDPMRALATRRLTNSNVYVTRRRITRPTSAWGAGESGTGTESTSTYDEKSIPLHALPLLSQITVNMLEDTGRDMYGEVLADMQEEMSYREGTAFINGTGVQQPTGILTSIDTNSNIKAFDQIETVDSPTAATDAIDFDILAKVYTSLNARYRANASWLMNSDGLYDVLRLADAANRLIWTRADASFSVVEQGAPATLLGRPLYISESMESPGSDKLAVAFGDWARGYYIVDKATVYLVRDTYTSKPDTEILLHMRVGGDVVKGEAIKIGNTT